MHRFHIHRFEFKYLISYDQYAKIRKELLYYMVHDPYSLATKDRFYLVSSLYYDSLTNINYWEKVDGKKDRQKIRFRTYSSFEDEKPLVFLEIKRKRDMVIIKDRALLNFDLYNDISNRNYDILGENGSFPSDQKKVIEEFVYSVLRLRLVPKICVTYKREAFFGKYHSNVRATFDKDIRGYDSGKLFPKWTTYQGAVPEEIVFELKFNGSLPSWFHFLIQKYNLSRVSCSKYCETMVKCNTNLTN